MKWYADNSELNGIKDADIPDILIFGGVAIRADKEFELCSAIEKIKSNYAHPRSPIKWNMKDLNGYYRKQGQEKAYESLLANSKDWRLAIFQVLKEYDVTFITSCIESYSGDRKVIKSNKDGLTRFAFNNALMRVGLHARDVKPTATQVILDWPDGGDSLPYDSEFASAYQDGVTACKTLPYHCGPLSSLRFADTPCYMRMENSTMLQVADLVVGATRELIEVCLDKKQSGLGVDCLKLASSSFYGAPNIVGWGVSVSTGNSRLRNAIVTGIKKHIYQ